jgi:hypothetical protein
VRLSAQSADGQNVVWKVPIPGKSRNKTESKVIHMLAIKKLLEEVRDWEGPMGLVVDSKQEGVKEESNEKGRKKTRISKGEMTRMATKASVAADYLNTCLILEDPESKLVTVRLICLPFL